MKKKEIYRILELLSEYKPQYSEEIMKLARLVEACETDPVDEAMLKEWMELYPFFADVCRKALRHRPEYSAVRPEKPVRREKRSETPEAVREEPSEPEAPAEAQKPSGKVFQVHQPYSQEIRSRLKLAERSDNYRNWANAVKSLPEYTLPLPQVDADFIRAAKEIWNQNIYGNESVLHTLLRHSVEYAKTGKTSPILLYGAPGIGKTLVAGLYGQILKLPTSTHSGPTLSMGRGLAGSPNLYSGAGVGAIVQAMITHETGNPVICIDEIEKATRGYSSGPDFQNELLSVLDNRSTAWYDNFLEMEVDASHIPFIFTANDKNLLSAPLLDRMEVIEMDKPTLDMLQNIAQRFVLPNTMKSYNEENVTFDQTTLEKLVDMLWNNGQKSCRVYQKAVDYLVSNAYLKSLETGQPVRISEPDVEKSVALYTGGNKARPIGFGA